MKFIEFQENIIADGILLSFILNHIPFERENASRGQKIKLDKDEILYVKSGAIVEKKNNNKRTITRFYLENGFLHLPRKSESSGWLEVLATTSFYKFNTEILFSFLEDEGLLPHFIYQFWELSERDREKQVIMSTASIEERIIYILKFIFKGKYNEEMTTVDTDFYELPNWLNIKNLASIISASTSAASGKIKDLSQYGFLYAEKKPWSVQPKGLLAYEQQAIETTFGIEC